jgi:hypothetical protein
LNLDPFKTNRILPYLATATSSFRPCISFSITITIHSLRHDFALARHMLALAAGRLVYASARLSRAKILSVGSFSEYGLAFVIASYLI